MRKVAWIMVLLCLHGKILFAQDSIPLTERIANFPGRFFSAINKKAGQLEDKLVSNTEKTLKRLAKQEARLKKKLSAKDSLVAEQLFGNISEKYASLRKGLTGKLQPGSGEYIPYVDTLKTSLQFLTSAYGNQTGVLSGKLSEANASLSKLNDFQSKLRQADQIRTYLRQRRAQLKEQLDRFGLVKQFQQYNKQAYYYSQQIHEYKELLKDPSALEKKALGLLQKLPAFQQFMSRHSELASLFPAPDNYGTDLALAGLQTRAGVQNLIQQRTGLQSINLQQQMSQNISAARTQFEQLREKITAAGGNSSDFDMPDFKPNTEKTKSFLKRLEYGTNLQSTKSNGYWPVTSDIGLTVGYKLNDKAVIGIGGSYKVGWGRDIRNIVVTHEGIGLRSFVDLKLKGGFYISGGYEQNYRQRFESVAQLKGADQWQQSGLIGLSKIVSIKTKFFKKTKLQLLWDFLSYEQVPREQPVKFRVGYNF
jgi:hypothetical protein